MSRYFIGKTLFVISVALYPMMGNTQSQWPDNVDTTQHAVSMKKVNGQFSQGQYRYFENGEAEPFSGILYTRYENGSYKTWQQYQEGIGQGYWINFYENGQLKEWGTYIRNRVEGPIRKYHENGKLAAKGIYREWRVRVGEWEYYDQSGNLSYVENYGKVGDFRDVEEYYRSGQISRDWYNSIINSKNNHKEKNND